MNYILRLLFCLSIPAAVLFSCVKEKESGGGDIPEGIPVNISIASETRLALEDDPHAWLDYQVTSLRIMGYHSQTGRLFFNRLVTPYSDGSNTEGKDNANPEVVWTADAEILTGEYTIVIIANEDIKQAFSDVLQDEEQVGYLSLLEKVTLDYRWLEWNGRIPMLAVYENVQVVDDNHIIVAGKEHKGTWGVELERVAVRVDVTLNLTPAQGMAWEKYSTDVSNSDYLMYVDNIPERMYLLGKTSDAALVSTEYGASTSSDGYNVVPGKIQSGGATTSYKIEWPRIIIPEYLLSQKDDPAKAVALRIGMVENGAQSMVSGKIGYDLTAPDYSLPRNHYIEVEASMKAPTEEELDITLTVKDWDMGMAVDVDINGPYTLTVDETIVTLPWQGGTFSFDVKTDFPGQWTAVLSTDNEDADSGTPGWLTKLWNGPFTGNQTLTMNYPENTVEEKSAYLHITAGRFTVVTKIKQEYFNLAEMFAKSNVVMNLDGTLGFATTASENTMYPANQQGLMFKFGSLVGISAGDNNLAFNSAHVVFLPEGYPTPTAWADIPYPTDTKAISPYADDDLKALGDGRGYVVSDGIGDICRYISDQGWVSGRWRIPTAAEYQTLWNDNSNLEGTDQIGTWSTTASFGNGYGTTQFEVGWWIGNKHTASTTTPPESTLFFPAGGLRLDTDGVLQNYGTHGRAWSSTAYSNNGYSLVVNTSLVYPTYMNSSRNCGFPVRCIREY